MEVDGVDESKKRKRVWECPICLEENFPYVGKCGHCVCEDCRERLDKCPICRNVGAFKEAVPCWDLAKTMGVEKKAVPDLFRINAEDLSDTLASIISLGSIATQIMESDSTTIPKTQLDSIDLGIENVTRSFDQDCMRVYIPRIEKIYDAKKTNPTKIDVSGCIYGTRTLLTNLKKHTHGRLYGHETSDMMYVKPTT